MAETDLPEELLIDQRPLVVKYVYRKRCSLCGQTGAMNTACQCGGQYDGEIVREPLNAVGDTP